MVLVSVLHGLLLGVTEEAAQALVSPVHRKALAEVELPLAVVAAFVTDEDLPALSLVPDELVVVLEYSFAFVAHIFELCVVIGGIVISFVNATEEVPLADEAKLGVGAGALGHVLHDVSLRD